MGVFGSPDGPGSCSARQRDRGFRRRRGSDRRAFPLHQRRSSTPGPAWPRQRITIEATTTSCGCRLPTQPGRSRRQSCQAPVCVRMPRPRSGRRWQAGRDRLPVAPMLAWGGHGGERVVPASLTAGPPPNPPARRSQPGRTAPRRPSSATAYHGAAWRSRRALRHGTPQTVSSTDATTAGCRPARSAHPGSPGPRCRSRPPGWPRSFRSNSSPNGQ